ncbi:hypothetical protein ACJ41O_011013 [Fusarium nematophilum]
MRVTDLVLASLAAVSPAACAVASAPDGPFQLYAYGDNVGGLVLFSDGEHVYAGEPSLLNNAQAAPILIADNDGQWSCSPNTTALAKRAEPTWSNLTFAIPSTAAPSHDVQLVNATDNNPSDLVTSGFFFYGAVAFASKDREFIAMWQGIPSSVEGVYRLKWNDTDKADNAVIFTLTAMRPSN